MDRCTCIPGRAADGSEHGPCAWCEERAWQTANGMRDEDLQAMIDGPLERRVRELWEEGG